MTPDGLEVYVDELAAIDIRGKAKHKAADMVAEKVVEKYGGEFMKEVAESITLEEVRRLVLARIVDEIIESWRTKGDKR